MGGRRALVVVLTCLTAFAASAPVCAERLPMRRYSTADGLVGDYIVRIYKDSRGFLWFATRDGLSRFDGARFTNYGTADGLPAATVNGVLETRSGVYWMATNGGVYRFNPHGRFDSTVPSAGHLFVRYPVGERPDVNRINILFEDRRGVIWVGTDAGLFEMHEDGETIGFRATALPLWPSDPSFQGVHAIAQDAEGSLWIGGGWGLTRRLPDGRLIAYRMEPAGRDNVHALLVDRHERLWIGSGGGLVVLNIDRAAALSDAVWRMPQTIHRLRDPGSLMMPSQSAAVSSGLPSTRTARWYTRSNGLPSDSVGVLHLAADGRIRIGTSAGLVELDDAGGRTFGTANGLADNYITALADDGAGNLWIGTVTGATRLIPRGLITYDEGDGLNQTRVHALRLDRTGRLFVVSGDYQVSSFDGRRFLSIRPNLPREVSCPWSSPCAYLDRAGGWWMLGATGLYRFADVGHVSGLAARSPRAVREGGPDSGTGSVFSIFEDREGAVWLGTGRDGVVRWRPSSEEWRVFSEADGIVWPAGTRSWASAFVQDAAGDVWTGFYEGGVARFRNGRFRTFTAADGVPAGFVTALFLDSAGRLWIGTNQAGLTRVDAPDADQPAFVAFQPSRGLNIRCLTEDRAGRIYAGTNRGILRIDPASSRMSRFGTGEGLASDFVTTALRDGHGTLWFGTISGLSRLDPTEDPVETKILEPPIVHIAALRVRGVAQPVSELGDLVVRPMTLGPDQNQLEIEYFSFAFNSAEPLKYQYRIDGIDRDWSPTTELRSVNYGRLPSGSYRFQVRSVRSDGAVGASPAVVSFTVLAPLYARWWFILSATLLAGAAIVALYRARLTQLLRVERVRARIATDLHDDLGASLSQIAILAEVAQRPAQTDRTSLARIAETSRGLVDSMSDIVWAINPQVDQLSDLVHRMRRFTEDTLSSDDIELTFEEPSAGHDPRLGPEIRREIFLILKETVTNIAKHAECRRVTIALDVDRRRLRLRVSDDGRGFHPEQKTDGNGVSNMRRRVAAFGGRLEIQSAPGRGTSIEVDAPLQGSSGLLPR
jgi:ligand-binding sensor domain-containing protein/signal transduction histidine kinase